MWQLRGLVGLCDECVGFDKLEAEIKIDSDATDEQLASLKGAVDAHCPMVATLAKKVPVTTTIKKECSNEDATMDASVQKEQVGHTGTNTHTRTKQLDQQ